MFSPSLLRPPRFSHCTKEVCALTVDDMNSCDGGSILCFEIVESGGVTAAYIVTRALGGIMMPIVAVLPVLDRTPSGRLHSTSKAFVCESCPPSSYVATQPIPCPSAYQCQTVCVLFSIVACLRLNGSLQNRSPGRTPRISHKALNSVAGGGLNELRPL